VVVEVLGGIEPARTLVLAALTTGTPVVTANKSLLAAHGDELFDAASQRAPALRGERPRGRPIPRRLPAPAARAIGGGCPGHREWHQQLHPLAHRR
jgi:hypothetical protein